MIKLPTIDEDDDENIPSPQVSVVDKPNLLEDWLNVLLLILLYIMQGLIHGFSLALPIILQSKKMVTYGDQALFSVVQWPYSMKLLWAPMADALYLRCFGRRKSWLLPLQYLMSVLLIYFAYNIDDWLPESGKPNLKMIIYVLLATNLLTAAQDVVVDGWALTMLKKNNVGYASSCNFSGVYIGMFIGNVCPILFSSEEFCNKYLRSTPGSGGIISIKNFLYFWSIMFLLVTTLVGIFKKENDHRLEDGYVNINVFQSYKLLWNIFKIQHMKTFLVIVLTSTIGITLTDSSTNFKLIDAGLSKDDIMMITSSTFILKIGLPLVASKYAAGLKPISFYLKWMPTRILWSFTSYPLLLFFTPYLIKSNGILNVPTYYYFIVGIIFAIQEILNNISTTAMIAFFAQISDPRFGSTYMTLFNTVRSVGFLISNMLLLEMVDILTFNKCSSDIKNDCPVPNVKDTCNKNVKNCGIYVDGYYVEAVICLVIGLTWYSVFKSHLKNLESKSYSHWLVDLN